MVEGDRLESIQFSWGKKRRIGGKKKDVQFYESFTYDAVAYTLYDSVYLFGKHEKEPYIGKIIKIWENPDKTKKVKVLWFFRPHEISNYLGSEEISENELFLASGDGVGLTNVNPLEAIAGRCNVVCTSKDSRNPQPLDEELQAADFIFYRTFDVGKCVILDKLDEKIAGIEVNFLLNRLNSHKSDSVPKHESEKKEISGNAVASNDIVDLSKKKTLRECTNVKTGFGYNPTLAREENADSIGLLAKQESSLGEKPASCVVEETGEFSRTKYAKGNTCCNEPDSKVDVEESTGPRELLVKKNSSLREEPASSAHVVEVEKPNTQLENIAINKAGSTSKDIENDGPKNLVVDRKSSVREKPTLVIGLVKLGERNKNKNNSNILDSPRSTDVSVRSKVHNARGNQVHIEERAKVTKDSGEMDDRSSKGVKLDGSVKTFDERIKKRMWKVGSDSSESDSKVVASTRAASEDKYKSRAAQDSQQTGSGPSKKPKLDERLANNELQESFQQRSVSIEGSTICSQPTSVNRRLEVDKSRWFKRPPWKQQIQAAYELGTLVLLQNLDPSCTSSEVEDIVWQAFGESCFAKMIQQTAFLSPHSGQAFIIFKTKEAAEKVVRKLDDVCLLSNGRPLVGSFATPCFPRRQTTFCGHLAIDRLRPQMQREMKEAVSTSHCSQPNTLEYDMALEWCLLQERSDRTLKKLHEQQRQELANLKLSR